MLPISRRNFFAYDPAPVKGETMRLRRKIECGQSLIEFAFGAVLLLILLVGIVDLSRAFFTYIALRDAAQEGAVYGSICPRSVTAIEARLRSSSNTPLDLQNDPNIVVECHYITAGGETPCGGSVPMPGNGIRVRVIYRNFPITMPFLGTLIGTQTITLRAEVMDTILRNSACP